MKILLASFCVSLLLAGAAASSAADSAKPLLRHVVAFKFKESAAKADIDNLVAAFQALPKKISEIKAFEWGTNVSPEKHDKGFTHQFILTFHSDKDRDAYLVHPAHKEFGKLVGPVIADVFVIDFWAKP